MLQDRWEYASLSGQVAKSPRFLWTIGVCATGLLFLLVTIHNGNIAAARTFQELAEYTSPPSYHESYAVPRDTKKAIARSEELWRHNVEKRKDFIERNGGIDQMEMFSKKPWGRVQRELVCLLGCLQPADTVDRLYHLGYLRASLALP